MSSIYNYASVSEALKQLKINGYTYDFNLNPEDIILHPENYIINEIYQYEGNSGTGDRSAVYGIKNKFGLKGVFVTGTSANSTDKNATILAKVSIKNANEPYM
ncbi:MULTISPECIES: hypothetical protein [unclassified Flavobacterium]|uniref:hypothetical protein n=1 Tax=unclassified Flavobacterium TaxID=196869 RepID=UPI001292775C|nr:MULTISPECIES: hypothetical protein [unclassified Flavobacterium]MQP52314.1 hypothetical protein [Flavobacterium sp. LMO9]MQP62384.1 hypothetical protein [Flavobacterium sp. LMO6]